MTFSMLFKRFQDFYIFSKKVDFAQRNLIFLIILMFLSLKQSVNYIYSPFDIWSVIYIF